MKKILVIVFVLFSVVFFGQTKEERKAILEAKKSGTYNPEKEKIDNDSILLKNGGFNYTIKGLNPDYVVVEFDSLNQNELFNKAVNWIKETYKNPDEVIKTTIESKKIRFSGVSENYLTYKALGINMGETVRYTIEISFKDNRYKFQPILIEKLFNGYNWTTIKAKDYYKKNGKIKPIVRNYPYLISLLFTELNLSLKDYINTNHDSEKW